MSFLSRLDSLAATDPGAVSLRGGNTIVTRSEVVGAIRRLGADLSELGVSPGDRVVVVLPNSISLVETFHAVLAISAVVVPVHPGSTRAEIARVAADCRPAIVVADEERGERVSAALAGLPEPPLLVLLGCEARNGSFHTAPAEARPPDRPQVELRPDAGVILYTSGTSGLPRGAYFDEAAVEYNVDAIIAATGCREDDTSLVFLPLCHSFAQNVAMNATLLSGGALILMDGFDPRRVWNTIVAHPVTRLYGVPAALSSLARFRPPSIEPRSIRFCMSAGDHLDEQTAERIAAAVGVGVVSGYGLTEAGLVACGRGQVDQATVGTPLRGVSVTIADKGSYHDPDIGEIVVSGPSVMRGYWSRAEQRSAPIPSSVPTGDLGRVSENGRLTIAGRIKSLLKVSGRSVLPEEVEEVLREHPAVEDVRVYGIANGTTGTTVAADVVAVAVAGRSVSSDDLRAHCAEQLSAHKVPVAINFTVELARGPLGKTPRPPGPSSDVCSGTAAAPRTTRPVR